MTTADDLLATQVIPVIVKPSAAKTAILGVRNGCLHVAVAAPAQDGKANTALLRFLSRKTGKRCALISGASSKKKLVRAS